MKNLFTLSTSSLNFNSKKHLFVFTIIIVLFSSGNVLGQQWLFFQEDITASWVEIGDLDVAGSQITVEALISARQQFNHNIVSKHTNPADVNYLLRAASFEITTTGGFVLLVNPIILCSDSVYHVVGSYDGDSVRYFVNGTQVISAHLTGDMILNDLITAIGNRSLSPTEQFYGYIDEVRIWNIVRSQEDIINNMYNLPDPEQQTGLLAYYKFEGDFANIQGNSSWNGVAVGEDVTLTENPYFNGLVSSNFCDPAGYNEFSLNSDIIFFPNPSSNKITFPKEIERVIIYNQLGVAILDERLTGNTISVAKFDKGIYIVEMIISNTKARKKLIIN